MAGLLDKFISAAQNSAATVQRAPCSADGLAQAVLSVCVGARGILLAESDFLPAGLFEQLKLAPGVVSAPDEDQLANAEVGVSGAFAGVARTGSVCVRISKNLEYSVGLFTRRHIAVLSAGAIAARPRDVFTDPRFTAITRESDFVFVTGPSATADMGSLVRGVHGPGQLHIIILDI